MAMTVCRDCGAAISSTARVCPNCGRPGRYEGIGGQLFGMAAFFVILFGLFVLATWLGWI